MSKLKYAVAVLLMGCSSFSVLAAQNTVFETGGKKESGTMIVNGKVVTYPKCVKKDAKFEDKEKARKEVDKVRRMGHNITIKEGDLPECKE